MRASTIRFLSEVVFIFSLGDKRGNMRSECYLHVESFMRSGTGELAIK